jgi:hypothetical protein
MKKKTEPPRKTKAKSSLALTVPAAAIAIAAEHPATQILRVFEAERRQDRAHRLEDREAMRVLRGEIAALQAHMNAANAIPIPVIAAPNTTIQKADMLSVKEAADIVHLTKQNIYAYIDYVGFEIVPGTYYVSNAKLRKHWPDRYDEALFWEIARRPINSERFASILAMLPEPQPEPMWRAAGRASPRRCYPSQNRCELDQQDSFQNGATDQSCKIGNIS